MIEETLNTEQSILKAAEYEFITKGYRAAKTTDIARAAGVTHAMLHYYFRTKENLFNNVLNQKMKIITNSLAFFFIESEKPVKDRIAKGIEAHFDFIKENPDLPRFAVNEIISKPESHELFRKLVTGFGNELISKLQSDLDKEAEDGKIAKVNAFDLLLDIISLNVFVFIMFPMIGNLAVSTYGSDEAFFERKKKENVKTIMKRLSVNK